MLPGVLRPYPRASSEKEEMPPTPEAEAMVSGEEMNLCGASGGRVSVAIRVHGDLPSRCSSR